MRRLAAATWAFAILATLAGAQSNPPAPLAGEQLLRFQSNRELLESLIEHGIDLANADTPVAKVKACRESAKDLGRALRDAADRNDADRVVEIGDHLTAIIRFGLLPTIDDARRTIPAGTPADQELMELTLQAAEEARGYELAIPAIGKLGTSESVRDIKTKLSGVQQSLNERNQNR